THLPYTNLYQNKGRRLGRLLTDRIIRYARARGTHWLVGEALRENTAMIALARASGFTMTPTEDPGVVGFRMALDDSGESETPSIR
ncbi:N-acetyltransferase family protein, partial [Paraburkholderia graminis]|uniref:GNAT family N-acetyltransferase n=1 Tax=Paraburkholderia graminis TaxID=60548 RepID=UPI00389A573D